MQQTTIKVISPEKKTNKMIAVARKSEKSSSFGFFVTIIFKDKFVVLRPLPAVVTY